MYIIIIIIIITFLDINRQYYLMASDGLHILVGTVALTRPYYLGRITKLYCSKLFTITFNVKYHWFKDYMTPFDTNLVLLPSHNVFMYIIDLVHSPCLTGHTWVKWSVCWKKLTSPWRVYRDHYVHFCKWVELYQSGQLRNRTIIMLPLCNSDWS